MDAPFTRLALASVICAACAACAAVESLPRGDVRHGDIVLAPDSEVIPGRVPERATLVGMLAPRELQDAEVDGVVAAASHVFDLRKLRAGQQWRIERTQDGCVRYLEYEVDAERFLRVTARTGEPHAFDAAVVEYGVRKTTVLVAAVIDEGTPSLFAAMAAEGETPELPMALAAIFGGGRFQHRPAARQSLQPAGREDPS
jgi:hypothetical protein